MGAEGKRNQCQRLDTASAPVRRDAKLSDGAGRTQTLILPNSPPLLHPLLVFTAVKYEVRAVMTRSKATPLCLPTPEKRISIGP